MVDSQPRRSDQPVCQPAQPPRQHSRLLKVLPRAKRRSWLELTWNFPGERDCLASFIALETAEVLAGHKPANLVRLINRPQLCGRNLYRLWQHYGRQLLDGSPLEACCCRENEREILLLFYRPQLLERRICGHSGRAFLDRCGYPLDGFRAMLDELANRFRDQSIPHEVGVFLGYPLKDVAAFLGWNDSPFTCQRGWKIFGKARRSLALADRYQSSRNLMSDRLILTGRPEQLLQAF